MSDDAVAAIARFSRYRPLRRDLYLQGLWGDHHAHNQNREVIGSLRRREAAGWTAASVWGEDRWQEPFVMLSPLSQLSGAPRLPPPTRKSLLRKSKSLLRKRRGGSWRKPSASWSLITI